MKSRCASRMAALLLINNLGYLCFLSECVGESGDDVKTTPGYCVSFAERRNGDEPECFIRRTEEGTEGKAMRRAYEVPR